jgi:hypothetical protein
MSKHHRKHARRHASKFLNKQRDRDAGRFIDELNKTEPIPDRIELGAAKPLPDLDLHVEVANTPEGVHLAKQILRDAQAAGVETFVKTYKQDIKERKDAEVNWPQVPEAVFDFTKPQLRQQVNADNTHSIGIRPHPHNHEIARSLLNIAGYKSHVGPMAPPIEVDDRPLIDLLHEATFTNPLGMKVIKDPYELRMLLRKAHCFTLDDATSAMIADFSLATVPDLEATRQMAIPPFPVTWIELNNFERLKRMHQLKFPLKDYYPEIPPTNRIGWLIHPAPEASGYYATYVANIDVGIWIAPMSYWWHTYAPNPEKPDTATSVSEMMEWLMFGTAGNVGNYDAFMHPSNLHIHYTGMDPQKMVDVMKEMAGELRHIWGFLIALGAGHLGAQATYTPQPKPNTTPPIMKNGKPLLPLEHKVLHLHLNKKTPAKIVAQAITHHHNRRHEVRAHWRQLKSGKRVPVKSHERGNELLGRIEKTYHVER